MLRSQQRSKIEVHDVFTERVKKITLSANDDRRMLIPDRGITYPLVRGNWNWPPTPVLTVAGSGWRKTNAQLTLIHHQEI